jgi:hypothetical protein
MHDVMLRVKKGSKLHWEQDLGGGSIAIPRYNFLHCTHMLLYALNCFGLMAESAGYRRCLSIIPTPAMTCAMY